MLAMPMLNSETIAVAMSGGVDSSAVAAMLRAEGRNVIGLTMQLWNQRRLAGHEGMPESVQGRCCSIDDVYDARRVAETLGIPYYVVNHEERFERDVVRPFVEEYLAGRTPIPCSLCNNHLKFDQLLIVARQIGADKIATGHYAQVVFDEQLNRWLLKRPADESKDQTYFLFGLTQEQLSRTLFPLGGMTKPEVRELARKHRPCDRRKARLAGDLLRARRRLQAFSRSLPHRAGRRTESPTWAARWSRPTAR
jgi:tRNA-uridine 2-sulfurtransferase